MVQPRDGGKNQLRGRTGEEEEEGQGLPEFTVAGCGRARRRVYREVTNEKSKMEESEQQFESRPVSVSPRLQVCSPSGFSSFRTSWDPRRRLASGSRPSRMWGNLQRCSCREPETHKVMKS